MGCVCRDMEDSIQLASAVHTHLGWPLVRAPVPPERLEFEELCALWAKHRDSESVDGALGLPRLSHAESRASSVSVSTMEGPPSVAPPSNLSASQRGDAATLVSLEPYERMSRTVKSFVAWKAGP